MMEGESCSLPSDRKLKIYRNAEEAGGKPQPFPVGAAYGSKEDTSIQAGLSSASSTTCMTVLNGVLGLAHLQGRSMSSFSLN